MKKTILLLLFILALGQANSTKCISAKQKAVICYSCLLLAMDLTISKSLPINFMIVSHVPAYVLLYMNMFRLKKECVPNNKAPECVLVQNDNVCP